MGHIDEGDRRLSSPETASPQDALRGFFGWAEQEHPQGVASMVSTVTSLIPRSEKPLTALDVRDGLSEMNCDIGLKLFSSWLDEIGVGGFRQLGLIDKGKVGTAKALLNRKGIQLPQASRVSDPESQAVLRVFSSAMRRFSQESLGAKAPFGLLFAESIGSQLSSQGSRQLRSALETSLQGHFDWLRNTLGVRDVAQNPDFVPMDAPKPTPVLGATGDFQDETEAERRARDERLALRIPVPESPPTVEEQTPLFPDYRDPESLRSYFRGGGNSGSPSRLGQMGAFKRSLEEGVFDASQRNAAIDLATELQVAIRQCPPDVALPFEPQISRAALLKQLARDLEAFMKSP